MKRICIVILSVLLTGCQGLTPGVTTAEISAGSAILNSAWVGSGPVIRLGVRHTLDNGVWVEYSHTSNLSSGSPFNDDFENNLDSISIGKTFTIKSLSKK